MNLVAGEPDRVTLNPASRRFSSAFSAMLANDTPLMVRSLG